MTWINISPTDVWLFRDGKPFSAGADHNAQSMFPPTPITVQGALRAKISMGLGVSFHAYKTRATNAQKAIQYIGPYQPEIDTGLFMMQGPFLCLAIERRHIENPDVTVACTLDCPYLPDKINYEYLTLLPAPADLMVQEYDDGRINMGIAQPQSASFFSDLHPDEPITMPGIISTASAEDPFENWAGYWLTARDYATYLQGDPPAAAPLNPQALFTREYRFGVSTNALTSYREDGQLYNVGFIRMHPKVSLLVDVTGIPAEDANLLIGPLTIGGEQGQATATLVESDINLPEPPATISGKFKIILLTPAYFSAGWEPEGGDWSQVFGTVAVEFVTAALYRPQLIGGWSSATGTARTMHAYAAAGSVYYFDAGEQTIELPPTFTQNPTDIVDAGRIGFGHYAVARWS